MKKIFVFIFVLSFLFNLFVISTNAITKELETKSDLLLSDSLEKVKCKNTIDDEFVDNEIVIVLNKEKSYDMNKFTAESFNNVGCVFVDDSSNSYKLGENIISFWKEVMDYFVHVDKSLFEYKEVSYNTIKDFLRKIEYNYNYKSTFNKKIGGFLDNHNLSFKTIQNYHRFVYLTLSKKDKMNVLKMIKKLEEYDWVISAEPNFIIKKDYYTNDTYSYLQTDSFELISLDDAWNITTGNSNIKVGVVDTGVQGDHEDLQYNINSNLGYSYHCNALTDIDGHGTMVASAIGAEANNQEGISGICQNVNLISIRASTNSGQLNGNRLMDGIFYAINNNIDLLNMSLGFTESESTAFYSAFSQYDGLIICSAGNQHSDLDQNPYYPSSYGFDNIISVAASYSTSNGSNEVVDELTSFSNYGQNTVDLAAPGKDVCLAYLYDQQGLGKYKIVSGTSFSAPLVTGTAALIKSIFPTIKPYAIKKAILEGVDCISNLSDKVKSGGRLNVYKALQKAEECTFNIQYNSNGGTGQSMQSTEVTYGVPTQISENTYLNQANYLSFYGWNAFRHSDCTWHYKNNSGDDGWYVEGTQPIGYSKILYNDGETVQNETSIIGDTITLYAQWRSNSYDLTFIGNGGQGSMTSISGTATQPVALQSNQFVKNDSLFKHWVLRDSNNCYYCYQNGVYYWDNVNNLSDSNLVCWENESIFQCIPYDDHLQIQLVAVWIPKNSILKGDVDFDGELTADDVTLIQLYLLHRVNLNEIQLYAADIDCDDDVTIDDVTSLQLLL